MSVDGYMPHRFPANAPDEVIAWACAECGKWCSEGKENGDCPIDWR